MLLPLSSGGDQTHRMSWLDAIQLYFPIYSNACLGVYQLKIKPREKHLLPLKTIVSGCFSNVFSSLILIVTSACECCYTKIHNKCSKLLTCKLIISSWATEMTFWHWKRCILGVACLYLTAFVTNIEGSIFIIACWEFPSASIHCWPPLYARVWEGWSSLSNAAWMTDRLVFALCCSICAAASLFCPLGSGCARKQHIFSWPFAFGESWTTTHPAPRNMQMFACPYSPISF